MRADNLNSFDRIAPYYDRLAGLVFGGSIRSAQLIYLRDISTAETILIIGGGTGWLLEEVLKVNHSCVVWYIESSQKMLQKTRMRCNQSNDRGVVYTHGTETAIPVTPMFDAVIANFFLDVFTTGEVDHVIRRIEQSMRRDGVLLCADFNAPVGWWQRLLMSMMYAFFGVAAKLKTISLPSWKETLQKHGFQLKKSSTYYKGFISSTHYKNREKI